MLCDVMVSQIHKKHWQNTQLVKIVHQNVNSLDVDKKKLLLETWPKTCVISPQLLCIIKFGFFHVTTFCLSFSWAFLPYFFHRSGHEWSGLDVRCFLVSLFLDHICPFGSFSWSRVKLSETCPFIRQISWPIDIPIIIDAAILLNIQVCMCNSGDVNVFQRNREWFSRRVKFDSWFNVMAVYEVSWHGPKFIYRFTGIRKWVVRW